MQNLLNFFNGLPPYFQLFGAAVGIVGLCMAGVMFMLGRKKREEGKEVATGVIEGLIIIFMAASFVGWLVTILTSL